jgi:hypothetical protein
MEWMNGGFSMNYLREDLTGWEIQISKDHTQNLLTGRWNPVRSPDVARFCRDYIREDIRQSLDQLAWSSKSTAVKFQLRAMLLNESPVESAAGTNSNSFHGNQDEVLAYYLATLRATHAPRFDRLIPPGEPSPFVPGTPREIQDVNPGLLTDVKGKGERAWPRLEWPGWKSATGAPWTFGRIQPVREGQPPSAKRTPMNRNSEVLTYTLP